MRCHACSRDNPPAARFCLECGARRSLTCAQCSSFVPEGVVTARPEFRPPWALHAHHAQLTLTRLSRRQTREMLGAVAAHALAKAELVEALVARTDGCRCWLGAGARYTFKHTLVREAAYKSLLKSRRRELHRRAAAVLDATPGTPAAVLAQHWELAGATDQAIAAWQTAAEAAQRSGSPLALVMAHTEVGFSLRVLGELAAASAHLEQALALFNEEDFRSFPVSFEVNALGNVIEIDAVTG
jgi:hypothetical protein